MSINELDENFSVERFASVLKIGKSIVGLDIGSIYIGLAFSDEGLICSFPSHRFRRQSFKKDAEYISNFIEEKNACGLVIGFPPPREGQQTSRFGLSIIEFANFLKNYLHIQILLQDESFSSKDAFESLEYMGIGKKQAITEKDAFAAAIILRRALEEIRNIKRLP